MKKTKKRINKAAHVKRKIVQQNDKIWSELVRLRDNFVCQMCVESGKKKLVAMRYMQAHHIIGRSNKAVRWELDNGITLCYYHHRYYVHGGRMDADDLMKFYYKQIGKNVYRRMCVYFDDMEEPDDEYFIKLGKEKYEELKRRSRQEVNFNLEYVMRWNGILRQMFLDFTGMTWEEYLTTVKNRSNNA